MIQVEQLTEEGILKRIDSLPQGLQDALSSTHHTDIVNQICAKNHLADEEKKETIQQIVAFVLLGFLHSYDTAQEINDGLNLNNLQLAREVANELDVKIFSPLKNELENNYRPLVPEEKQKSVAEILPPNFIKEPRGGEVPAEKLSAIKINEVFGSTPFPLQIPTGRILEGKSPATMPSMPPLKFSPKEINAKPSVETPGKTEPIRQGFGGELSRTAQGEPAPTMLHEEAVTKPLRAASGFSIEVPMPKLSEAAKLEAPPLKPAVLEFGGSTPLTTGVEPEKQEVKKPFDYAQGKPPVVSPVEPPKPRVVHYTEFRTPLEKEAGTALTPPQREIKEITAAAPPLPAASRVEPPTKLPLIKEAPKIESLGIKPPVPPATPPPPPRPRIEPPPVRKPEEPNH